MKKLFFLPAFALVFLLGGVMIAQASYSVFDDAAVVSGGNPGFMAQVTSDASPGWGGVEFSLPSGVTVVNDLSVLSADYKVLTGDCGGGSPRFVVRVASGNVFVYFGPAPSFTGCTNAWTSSGNLLASPDLRVDTSQVGGTFYDTWANAKALVGSSPILDLYIVMDGGWAVSGGVQSIGFDNVAVNPEITTFEPVDTDRDGVLDEADKCEGTSADSPNNGLGVNRLMWDGAKWVTKSPKGKVVVDASTTMSFTHGCSCEQILDTVKAAFGSQMEGHYKFGCSKSVIQDWNADWSDGVLDGKKYLETVTVDSAVMGGASSTGALMAGKNYVLESSGTWTNRPGETVDTKFTTMDGWVTSLEAPAGGYPNELLDLQVNNAFLDWGAYSSAHQYSLTYTPGASGPVNFRVFDGDVVTNTPTAGWYGDNVGTLMVKISAKLW